MVKHSNEIEIGLHFPAIPVYNRHHRAAGKSISQEFVAPRIDDGVIQQAAHLQWLHELNRFPMPPPRDNPLATNWAERGAAAFNIHLFRGGENQEGKSVGKVANGGREGFSAFAHFRLDFPVSAVELTNTCNRK